MQPPLHETLARSGSLLLEPLAVAAAIRRSWVPTRRVLVFGAGRDSRACFIFTISSLQYAHAACRQSTTGRKQMPDCDSAYGSERTPGPMLPLNMWRSASKKERLRMTRAPRSAMGSGGAGAVTSSF